MAISMRSTPTALSCLHGTSAVTRLTACRGCSITRSRSRLHAAAEHEAHGTSTSGSHQHGHDEHAHRHHVDPSRYDMDFWHYKPRWCQPTSIVATGVAFVLAANIMSDHSIKITILAAGPVALWWWIFLVVVPNEFKSFAVDYMESHDMGDELDE